MGAKKEEELDLLKKKKLVEKSYVLPYVSFKSLG